MPRIIVKALRKRNEMGLATSSLSEACREWLMFSIISSDQFVQKYAAQTAKSVQACAHSRHMARMDLDQRCDCHPSKDCDSAASRCSSAMKMSSGNKPTTCSFLKYIGTKGAPDRTVLLRPLNIATQTDIH
jgi:hypothetical protein